MNRAFYRLFVLLLSISFLACEAEKEEKLVKYVDPYIGSDYHGHVFVGASVPFGAVQLGPNNFHKGWDWCSGYHYSDSIVKGFSHLHLSGTGCADLGDILIMPANEEINIVAGSQDDHLSGYASLYSHENEKVEAGYYQVMLERYGINVELTSTERVGFHKYTFPESKNAHIIIDLGEGNSDTPVETFLRKVDDNTITGYRFSKGWAADQRVFFALKSSKPFESVSLYDSLLAIDGHSGTGQHMKAIIQYGHIKSQDIMVKVALSPVSEENALGNIQAEIPEWDFASTLKTTQDKWEKELRKITVEADLATKRTFYTALFHSMIAPSLFNDYNGDYRGTDKKVYQNAGFNNYTVFSLWDTYRAAHPLFTITQPERVDDMVNSMLAIYQQQGKLPVWHLMGNETNTMVGYHAVPVIVDAYFKGFRDYDVQLAFEACSTSAMRDERGLKQLKKYSFIPALEEVESVAKAMEYAIDDWCIAQFAKDLGKMDDYEYFLKRSNYYKNYFDPETGFMRGRVNKNEFRWPFDPIKSLHRADDYCEGNAWQYTWLVPHDIQGLTSLFGSKEALVVKLDSLFAIDSEQSEGASVDISGLIGQYAHGNEPGHHTTYIYTLMNQPWKTAEKVRYIMKDLYTDKPVGLCGNEDCGQMSAWYLFSSLGFYPVNPANGIYIFGSPALDAAELALPDGKSFKLTVHNNSDSNIYIQKISLNGHEYDKSYIEHTSIMEGGHLEIWMGDTPSESYGTSESYLPTKY